MDELNELLKVIDSHIGGSTWFILFLLGTGIFFTIYLGFPQLRYMGMALNIVRGKYDDSHEKGDTTHFQALATALSSTVGTGNIAGVALAIHLGGPAAMFWMFVTALLGMCTKMVEVTLSHKYREVAEDGTMSGGPMYYMKNALNLKWLAVIFAIATILSSFGTGALPQINSISNSLFSTLGVDKMLTGAVLSVLLALIVIGGIKRIASVTEKLVPFMAIIYFLGSLIVIISNYENIIPSFYAIIHDVFTGSAATGGFLGATISFAMNRGVNRGLFSNEAGQGSAPIAHASAKAKESASEGLVALLEPFIDTIVICTLTGLVLLSSGAWKEKHVNHFQQADISVISGHWDDHDAKQKQQLGNYILYHQGIQDYTGDILIENGAIKNAEALTVIHARSVAEDLKFYNPEHQEYTGTIHVNNGTLFGYEHEYYIEGKSLMHSAPLTAVAFTKSFLGNSGQYVVSFGLLLFAFSTAVAWCYYGTRATIFLWGIKAEIYYKIIYVIGFFFAAFMDTTIIWTFSGITIALMTLPNLFGILMLRKEMKHELKTFIPIYKKKMGKQ